MNSSNIFDFLSFDVLDFDIHFFSWSLFSGSFEKLRCKQNKPKKPTSDTNHRKIIKHMVPKFCRLLTFYGKNVCLVLLVRSRKYVFKGSNKLDISGKKF
jgi:hypothetical protein